MSKDLGRLAGGVCVRLGMGSAVVLAASAVTAIGIGTAAEAKTPGKTYCFYSTCHRVKSIAETEALIGAKEIVQASHYDDCKRDRYNPCGLTSSGEAFRSDQPDNVASPIYPDGTTLLLWSPATRNTAVVRVNNAGPYWGKRKLDVSRTTAERLGFDGQGVTDIEVRVVSAPTQEEATYRRNRKYRPVPGYLGKYADTELAHAGAAAIMAVDQVVVAMLSPLEAGTAVAAKTPERAPAPVKQPVRVAVAEAHAQVPAPIVPPATVAAAVAPAALADDAIEARKRIAAASARRSNAARYAMQTKKRIAARYASAKTTKGATIASATAGSKGKAAGTTKVAMLAPQATVTEKRPPVDVSPSAWTAPRGPAFFRSENSAPPQAAAGVPLRKTAWKSSSVANKS